MLDSLLGISIAQPEPEEYKKEKRSPFDYIGAINTNDAAFWDDDREREYNAFIINKGLSYNRETIIQANEVNSRPHLDRKLQFNFLINTIRPRKRFDKWIKPEKDEVLDVIKEYYGYSNRQARLAVSLHTPAQIDYMRTRLNKGG